MGRRISILGSTGSIGSSTLDIISQHRETFCVEVLTAQSNAAKLIEQAKRFKPKAVVIGDEAHHQTVKDALAGDEIEVMAGEAALCEAASRQADLVMAAIVGAAGLRPTLAAIQTGATIALANKECLVCAGELMLQACRTSGSQLLPVDSEHNAIFQVIDFDQPEQIAKLTLTASGGPFRDFSPQQLASITPAQAVAHPNWSMGAKISVDSATMMNKALEMIEAYHLFPVAAEQIEAIIHPQSIIHSLVHYRDGSVLAQLGMPDMRIPIAYALGWPQRLPTNSPTLSLAEIGTLGFEPADEQRFAAMRLVRGVLAGEQSLSIAFNAANEVAVDAFLQRRLPFVAITQTVETILEQTKSQKVQSIEDALYLDTDIRKQTLAIIGGA